MTAKAERAHPAYRLESELAQMGLAATEQDSSRKLAWVNSVCIAILFIGLFGSKPAPIEMRRLPPIEQATAAIVEPLPPPPAQETTEPQPSDDNEQAPSDVPRVVVVTPEAPAISFSVPTIGNLVVPSALAQAPPPVAVQKLAPLRKEPIVLNPTGAGGDRPQPPYPKIALEAAQQGSVTLRMTVDDAGLIKSVEVLQSSGFPILDRSAMDFVKRHWTVPPEKETRIYQVVINYKIQRD